MLELVPQRNLGYGQTGEEKKVQREEEGVWAGCTQLRVDDCRCWLESPHPEWARDLHIRASVWTSSVLGISITS